MTKIFFTSDTHFGHQNIIEYSKRPFTHVDQMDEALINRWNEVVDDKSTVYHLGDFSFHKPSYTAGILGRLKGNIHLVKGNHDAAFYRRKEFAWRFSSIQDYLEITVEHQRIVMCHFPFESWNIMHYGSWHLHGHSHGSLKRWGRRVDVGVDCTNFTPLRFDHLKAEMEQYKIEVRDYHKIREK